MPQSDLIFFTHSIDGKQYGGWYRLLSPQDIEVLGIGMMETVTCSGLDPETTARSVLEEFVRRRSARGVQIPALDEVRRPDAPPQVSDNDAPKN